MNADAYPGEEATVLETVTEEEGLVRFRGAPWSARILPAFTHEGSIPPGSKVRVEKVDGAYLLVSRTEFGTDQ
jgi:membrane protein implicated in regulation of membrane protease activity